MKSCNTIIHLFITPVLLLGYGLAYAALPPGFNYQGHLTDTGGVPVDGDVSMTLNIYNVETGGVALWTDSRTVTVNQGVFSIELGGTSNPFPLGLFENPLWLGLSVAGDGEMSPRRALTSTGYAFKADDANRLEGVSATTLDQSAHVTDTANPHNVTPAQIGASTGPHTIDTNAATICGAGQYLRGDGVCVSGFLDADGVDAYNAAYDTEAEIDAAVANNGYSTGAHTTDTNAGTICPNSTFLNGDGSCDTIPRNYPAVSYSGRENTSLSPVFFDEPNHKLTATYTGGSNDFTIVSDSTVGKYVVIDDGTGSTVSGQLATVGATLTMNVFTGRVVTIDLVEPLNQDKLYRYRCMVFGSANLVGCTQETY